MATNRELTIQAMQLHNRNEELILKLSLLQKQILEAKISGLNLSKSAQDESVAALLLKAAAALSAVTGCKEIHNNLVEALRAKNAAIVSP